MTTVNLKDAVNLAHAERLVGVNPRLQMVLLEAAKGSPMRLIVVEGVRTLSRQKTLYQQGATTTLASKHLIQRDGTGWAFDVAPLTADGKIDWNNKAAFRAMMKHIMATAKRMGVPMRTGSDWDMNGVVDELEIEAYRKKHGKKPFVDYPHFELV